MERALKTIRHVSDLAVNGAEPAFAEPLHVGRPNLGDREALLRYTAEIYDRRGLTNNGPLVQELEQRIAEELNVQHCVAMCNGTIALEIATRALGLEGEVIIPSYTFVATAHAHGAGRAAHATMTVSGEAARRWWPMRAGMAAWKAARDQPYRINLARLLILLGRLDAARVEIEALRRRGRGGQYEAICVLG